MLAIYSKTSCICVVSCNKVSHAFLLSLFMFQALSPIQYNLLHVTEGEGEFLLDIIHLDLVSMHEDVGDIFGNIKTACDTSKDDDSIIQVIKQI